MAQQYYNPGWIWHEVRKFWYFRDTSTARAQHFYYDQPRDQLVSLETGHVVPRSPMMVLPQGVQGAYVLNQQYPSSPTRSDNLYTSATRPLSESSQDADSLAAAVQSLQLGPELPVPSRPTQSTRRRTSEASRDSALRDAPPPLNTPIPSAPRPGGTRAGRVAAHVTIQGGLRITSAINEGGVKTIYADQPADKITDPTLLSVGFRAQRKLFATNGDSEELYSSFRLQKESFWILGRVFQVLWSEPAGDASTMITSYEPTDAIRSGTFTGRHGEQVYSKVRRFVVVRRGQLYSSAVPIMSYGSQGVGKRGVTKSEHAIIYTGDKAPTALRSEDPIRGEAPMRNQPIRVVPDVPTEKLDEMSRINFGKVSTVEHNLKVRSVGVVHPHSMQALVTQFQNVVNAVGGEPSRAGPSSSTQVQRRTPASAAGGESSRAGASSSAQVQRRTSVRSAVSSNSRTSGQPRLSAPDEEGEDDEGDAGDDDNDRGEEEEEDDDEETLVFNHLMRQNMGKDDAIRETRIALDCRARYLQLLKGGYSAAQAVDYLATQLVQQSRGGTKDAATSKVMSRLRYGNQ